MIECRYCLGSDKDNYNERGVFHRFGNKLVTTQNGEYVVTVAIVENLKSGKIHVVDPTRVKMMAEYLDRIHNDMVSMVIAGRAKRFVPSIDNYFKQLTEG
jgi:hypothetical protein